MEQHGQLLVILESASRLFKNCGVDATSLGDVAGDVKISKGTLYYYFPTKARLIEEVASRHYSRLLSAARSWAEGLSRDDDPMEALQNLICILYEDMRLEFALRACVSPEREDSRGLAAIVDAKRRETYVVFDIGMLRLYNPAKAQVSTQYISQQLFALIEAFLLRGAALGAEVRELVECSMPFVESFLAANYD